MNFLKSLFSGEKEVKERPRTAPPSPPPPPVKKRTQPKKQIRWQGSRAHLLLLSKYKKPQPSDRYSKYDDWINALGEPITMAINRFKNDSALRETYLTEKMSTYTVKQLKPMLKERDLPVSGKKAVLISRLVDDDPHGMQNKTSQLRLLTLTEEGKITVTAFEKEMAEEKENAIDHSIQALKAKNFKEAAIIATDYRAKQVSQSGVVIVFGDDGEDDPYWGLDHDKGVTECIFSGWPKLLEKVPAELRNDLRVGAAVDWLWSRGTCMVIVGSMDLAETGYKTIDLVSMLGSFGVYKKNLYEWEKGGVVKKASINTSVDELVCKNCGTLHNQVYSLATVPELPYEKCTCKSGCRCGLTPWVEGVEDLETGLEQFGLGSV